MVTDDIIELTIYNDITHIDITNHTEIKDMSIAALSLLPRLTTVWAGGSCITNLGIVMIGSARTISTLDLSKSVLPQPNIPPTQSPLLALPHTVSHHCLHVHASAALHADLQLYVVVSALRAVCLA